MQARLGIIPNEAAREIERQCRIENIDLVRLKQQTERIGYPILGVVQQIVALCADGLGEWCHWGATTQDITDTAAILQVRAALEWVERDMEAIAAALAELSRRHRDTPMAGRSNLQQAVPLTFGFKTATLLAAMQRHRERLAQLRPRVLVGEFGGAVGTLASLGADGLKVQAALMAELGLVQPEIAWHTLRDRIGEVACFLGLLTGTLGKISMDVKLLMQTEVAEVYEPFHEARGSSSTMPQKRNPVSCLYIHSTAAMVKQHVAALLEAAVADHERSTGRWEIEWIALPEIFLLASGALAQTRLMVSGLEVDAERMRANLDLTRGMVVSEAVMMGSVPISAASAPTTWSTISAARLRRPASRWSSCWRRSPKFPGISTAPGSNSSRSLDAISASPARWWTRCWRVNGDGSPGVAGLNPSYEPARHRRMGCAQRSPSWAERGSRGAHERRRQGHRHHRGGAAESGRNMRVISPASAPTSWSPTSVTARRRSTW